jgi:hypothetical protein
MSTALSRRLADLERRRQPTKDEPIEVQLARARTELIAAFGEADFAAAVALPNNDATGG